METVPRNNLVSGVQQTVLGVPSPFSIFLGSFLRERPAKSQTVQESTLPFYTPVPVRNIQQISVLAQTMKLTLKFVAAW